MQPAIFFCIFTFCHARFAHVDRDHFSRPQSESRKILWALLAALFIHLLVAFSLAAFGGRLTTIARAGRQAGRAHDRELVPTPPPVRRRIRSSWKPMPSKKSAEEPKEKTFESNANSIAASQLPATGDSALPTQEGERSAFTEFENAELLR